MDAFGLLLVLLLALAGGFLVGAEAGWCWANRAKGVRTIVAYVDPTQEAGA